MKYLDGNGCAVEVGDVLEYRQDGVWSLDVLGHHEITIIRYLNHRGDLCECSDMVPLDNKINCVQSGGTIILPYHNVTTRDARRVWFGHKITPAEKRIIDGVIENLRLLDE